MKIKLILLVILIGFSDYALAKDIVGWVEKASITTTNTNTTKGIEVKAKIDSGARNSSLHCDCVSQLNSDGDKMVHLKITNYKGETIELDKKVVRQVKIKRHDGKVQIRDVIMLSICLESVKKEVEVNLINRSGLNYQMLIGRSFLEKDFLIDTQNQFLTTPKCV